MFSVPFTITLPLIVSLPKIFTLPVIVSLPLTIKEPVIVVFIFISNPLSGDITASAEPDLILFISPIESALIFLNCEPSPTK
jgi:hypothetical protein